MPDTANPQPQPFAVWFRPNRREPWQRFAVAGTAEEARAAMYAAMGTGSRSGDWTTGPADRPPRPPKLWPSAPR